MKKVMLLLGVLIVLASFVSAEKPIKYDLSCVTFSNGFSACSESLYVIKSQTDGQDNVHINQMIKGNLYFYNPEGELCDQARFFTKLNSIIENGEEVFIVASPERKLATLVVSEFLAGER